MIKWIVIGLLAFCILFPGVAKLAWDAIMINLFGRSTAFKGSTTGAAVGGMTTQSQSPLIMGLNNIGPLTTSRPTGGLTTGTTAVTNP